MKKVQWTSHSQMKMRQYGLSKMRVIQVLRKPERVEEGIAEGTMAAMATRKVFGNKERKAPPGEIWLMYKIVKGEQRVISCWRYPGISKPGDSIPIPEDIRQELAKEET